MRIKVPGDMPLGGYGQMYYAINKRGELALVGDEAPAHIFKQYRLGLTEAEIKQHKLSLLAASVSDDDAGDVNG